MFKNWKLFLVSLITCWAFQLVATGVIVGSWIFFFAEPSPGGVVEKTFTQKLGATVTFVVFFFAVRYLVFTPIVQYLERLSYKRISKWQGELRVALQRSGLVLVQCGSTGWSSTSNSICSAIPSIMFEPLVSRILSDDPKLRSKAAARFANLCSAQRSASDHQKVTRLGEFAFKPHF